MNSLAPTFNSSIFNTNAFNSGGYLTKGQADRLYLPYSTYSLLNAVPGIATANKALIFDANININSINSLSANNLISISTTNSTSYLTGGSIFSGGIGIAKDIFTNGNITNNGLINSQLTDTSTSTSPIILNVNHLLSSGSPTINNFGAAIQFQMPNNINSLVGYSKIESIIQLSTNGLEQGQMNLYCKLGGSYIKAVEIASLTGVNNNIVRINGTTSVLSVYNISASILTGVLQTAAQPNITSINSATLASSAVISFTNTNVSLTSTSNAVQISGGSYFAKALLSNSYYNCNTQNSSATSYTISNQSINLFDHAIYFRGQTQSNTNSGIMYSGYNNANWNTSQGFASKSIDGPVLFGNTGVLIGSTSGGVQTAALSCISGNTNIYGTCYINNPPTMVNQSSAVQIKSTGYCMTLANDATYYTRLGTSSTGYFIIETNTSGGSGGNTINIFQDGNLGLTIVPRFRLDFGNTLNNFIICLYNLNNLNPTYGFGVNSSSLLYHSAGSNGHQFYINTTGGVGSSTTVGTNVLSLTTSLLNIFSTNTKFPNNQYIGSNSYQNLYSLDSAGVFLIGSNSAYSTSNWLEVAAGSSGKSALFKGSVVIGASATSSMPLYVSGTANSTTASGFGYLASSGAGTATGFTNRPFSIQCTGGILCDSGEIDVLSDMRLKTNIDEIDDKLCNKFIENIKPISFNYKCNKNITNYGFSAQELVKFGFKDLVGFVKDESTDLVEEIIICDDGNNVKLEKNTRLVVNLLNMIPILVNLIKQQKNKIDNIEENLLKLKKNAKI